MGGSGGREREFNYFFFLPCQEKNNRKFSGKGKRRALGTFKAAVNMEEFGERWFNILAPQQLSLAQASEPSPFLLFRAKQMLLNNVISLFKTKNKHKARKQKTVIWLQPRD